MGVVAALCGWFLQVCFCALDSSRFPVRSYPDLCDRLIGHWFRHIVNILQAIQILFMVAVLIIGNGQSLTQLIGNKPGHTLCFTVAVIIWPLLGMVCSQIRTLRMFSAASYAAVALNLTMAFVTMGVIRNLGIDWSAVYNEGFSSGSGPHTIEVSAFVHGDLPSQINGVANMIFAVRILPHPFHCNLTSVPKQTPSW